MCECAFCGQRVRYTFPIVSVISTIEVSFEYNVSDRTALARHSVVLRYSERAIAIADL